MSGRTAIILVTFNGWEMTRNCLNDLAAQLGDSAHFVVAVADNASTDKTVENIRKDFPAVHLYASPTNVGFGAANNLAIKGLLRDGESFDAVCLLNNDTRLKPDTLPQLRLAWEQAQKMAEGEGGKYALVAPTVKNPDGSKQPNYFAGLGPEGIGSLKFFTNAFRNENGAAKILQGVPQATSQASLAEVHWTSAVCWMFGKDLFDAICKDNTEGKFFDEKIFMYYEDADAALRARRLGTRFFIAGDIPLTHLGGGSAQNNTRRALQHDRAQQYVFKKHFGFRGFLLSKSFRFCRSLVRIVASLPRCIGTRNGETRAYIKHHFTLMKTALW
ncbi:MAG: glycosyltransferase family 2 protein [Fibrobacter sp.]|uniref:glycosyltransferase family 2 protein n=1 Tax=Fibrobacter sp. TaxID=35828 RepID=UPI0025BB81ED|nr:glycosyltransferase family 2 protein [Fibrobacter sp.]MBR4785178.1 glycosyltransferase family 2 protein [Fibrobacter sp.]